MNTISIKMLILWVIYFILLHIIQKLQLLLPHEKVDTRTVKQDYKDQIKMQGTSESGLESQTLGY